MPSDATVLLEEACDSGIACLSDRDLLIAIAEALAESLSMTAAELLTAACESKVACLDDHGLLIVIAQGVAGGAISPGGGNGVVSDGVVDPVAAPANPAVTNWYTNTATGTAWLWPAGGVSWQQIV